MKLPETAPGHSPGRHYIYDFYGCDPLILNQREKLRELLLEAVRLTGAQIISDIFHQFSPQGVTGVIAIAESHVAIHTWPELGFAAVDAFTCSGKMQVEKLKAYLLKTLKAERVEVSDLGRGDSLKDSKANLAKRA